MIQARTAFPGGNWPLTSPESQGVDSARVRAAMQYLARALARCGGAGTAVVIRNGRLIWRGPESDALHQIHSATKSFTSTCLGLLIDDGKASLDTLAADYVPELREHYPSVTLRHFATMTSGYHAPGKGYEEDAEGRWDGGSTPLTPAPPLSAPGTRFRYWDKAMLQFGNVLTHIAGEPLDRLFARRVAGPIGMKQWQWWPYQTDDGPILHWTGGICTNSLELARFGLLFLNRGTWDGTQLVSASWVDQATAVQVPNSLPNDEVPRSRGAGIYGHNWWVNGVKPDGHRLWPDVPAGAYYANGLHSNVCIVVPEWDLVVARTNAGRPNGAPNSPPNIDRVWNTFLARLGKAIID